MQKIPTIFERDWNNNGKITNQMITGLSLEALTLDKSVKATEKLDGTNVRITIRNYIAVRAEKRRNPDKIQKAKGIIEPWYVDASEFDSQDKYIFDGIKNTDLSIIPDGEWSGELLGKNIQGNPLNLDNNQIVFFSLGQVPVFEDVPTSYENLKEWLPKQKSKYGNNCGIEGIVWWFAGKPIGKIKVKDFLPDNRSRG